MKKHQLNLVGSAILPTYYAIKKFGPDEVHLVVTTESRVIVEPLLKLVQQAIPCHIHEVLANDPLNIRQAIERICSGEGEYTINLTGGNKLMALVAAEVAKERAVDAFYYAGHHHWIRMGDYATEVMEVTLDNLEIIGLSNHKIKQYTNFSDVLPQDIDVAKKICNFRMTHYPKYKKLMEAFGDKKRACLWSDLQKGEAKVDTLTLNRKGDNVLILRDNDGVLLDVDSRWSKDMLLNAGWWEFMVANAIRRWDHAREVWINASFLLQKDQKSDKNEVDVLVNWGQNLLFVECKSGNVLQSDIYKMLAVRKTYGGEKSKSLLVSFMPLKPDIREKCRDSNIEVLAPLNDKEGAKVLNKLPKMLGKLMISSNI